MAINQKMIGAVLEIGVDEDSTLRNIRKVLDDAGQQFNDNSLKVKVGLDKQSMAIELETLNGEIHKYVAKWNDALAGLEVKGNLSSINTKQYQGTLNELQKYQNKLQEVEKTKNALINSGQLDNSDIQRLTKEYDTLNTYIEVVKASQSSLSATDKAVINQQLVDVKNLTDQYGKLTKSQNNDSNSTYNQIEDTLKKVNQIQSQIIGKDGEQKTALQQNLNLENERLQALIDYKNINNLSNDSRNIQLGELELDLQNRLNVKQAEYNDLIEKQTQKLTQRFGAKQDKNYGISISGDGTDQNSIDNVKSAIQAQQQITAEFKGAQVVYDTTNKAWTQYTHKVQESEGVFRKITTSVNNITGEVRQNSTVVAESAKKTTNWIDKLKGKMKEIMYYFSASAVIYAFFNQLKKGISIVKEIDDAMTELRKVTDETDATYQKFQQSATAIGNAVGRTIPEVITATSEFAKLGYSINEASNMAEKALMLENIGDGLTLDASIEAMVASLKGFDMDGAGQNVEENSQKIIDSINEVDKLAS